jgi:hypothetical protein
MFENMGFEHVPEGAVLMCVSGGPSFTCCTLLRQDLFECIADHLDAGDEGCPPFPSAILRELTQDESESWTDEERQEALGWRFQRGGEEIFCLISNLWYAGHALTVATKPLLLPAFIQAVQAHGATVNDPNLVTDWAD